MSAVKHDKGKARHDLVSPYAIEALALVLAFGANKYGDRNWENGVFDQSFMERVYAAGRRHADAPRMGDLYDSESGYPHSWHELCNAMFKAHRDMILWKRRYQAAVVQSAHPMHAESLRDEFQRDDQGTGV